VPAHAQFSAPPPPTAFKDTSMVKPPAGAKVAIWVFEDLECPACANAHPIEVDAAHKYGIPMVRHDFPLPMHKWSFDAAVDARYIQDVVKNPALADQYRGEVFKAQRGIEEKEDLNKFTQSFARSHGIMWPFVVDPQGSLAARVKADRALGERIGLTQTPTIWVATNYGIQEVQDIHTLYSVIDAAIAATKNAPAAKPAAKLVAKPKPAAAKQ
jgi:protein-disulfide isomerase